MTDRIRTGTCSWADESLVKYWYAKGVRSGEERLRYYAEHFDTVELNSTYYRLPEEEMVAKWADAWHCFGGVDYLAPKNQRLDEMCEAAGRDPSTLLRAASISIEGSIDDIRREIDAWRDAGFGYLIAGWPSGGREQVEAFSAVLSEQG